MATTTPMLTLPQLKIVIRKTVLEELQELLGDPDFGLALRASARARLLQSKKSVRIGRIASAEELVSRLGLRV